MNGRERFGSIGVRFRLLGARRWRGGRDRVRFWVEIAKGEKTDDASAAAGWGVVAGGVSVVLACWWGEPLSFSYCFWSVLIVW
jgi:hypothetical protein